MAKKKDKKTTTFSKMLKDNQKIITVVDQEGKTKNVSELTSETLNSLVASPLDGVIPVSSVEAVENSVPGARQLSISTAYAQSVFSMYEFALKYNSIKQTLVIAVPEKDVEDILDADYIGYGPLKERSNLKLVLDNIPEKVKKKIINWSKADDVPAMFVIRIPNMVIFHGDIKKNTPSKAKFFDLVIEVLRSGKSLPKLKKKNPEEFSRISDYFVKSTVRVLREFGVSCVHIPLNKDFYDDPHKYATAWCEELSSEKNTILTRVVFCTPDPDDLVSFNTQIAEDLVNKVLDITMV